MSLFYRYLKYTIFFGSPILVIVMFGYTNYLSSEKELKKELSSQAKRIDLALSSIFDEVENQMVHLGKSIVDHKDKNLTFIAQTLSDNKKFPYRHRKIPSWHFFDWVNTKKQLVYGSENDSFLNISVNHRAYTTQCPSHPWTLQFSLPSVGIPTSAWQVPAGMGITDKNNNFIGIITLGFYIDELNEIVSEAVSVDYVSFIVLNNNYQIVLQSSDNAIDPKSLHYYDFIHPKNIFNKNEGMLKEDIVYKDIHYRYYKKIAETPFIILAGTHKQPFFLRCYKFIDNIFIEFLILGYLSALVFFIFRKKMDFMKRSSNNGREKFIQKINLSTQETVANIHAYTQILWEQIEESPQGNLKKEKNFNILKNIQKEISHLENFTTNRLNITEININNLIKESVEILYNTRQEKEMNISLHLEENLPCFFGDELRLKQIFVGSLSLSLEYTQDCGSIKIFSSYEKLGENSRLIIKIFDNGFALGRNEIERMYQKFLETTPGAHNGINLSVQAIESLVQMHKGSYWIESQKEKGKQFIVFLPLLNMQEILREENKRKLRTSNVYDFPKIK